MRTTVEPPDDMNPKSEAERPVITTDKKTGLPLIECPRAAPPSDEPTPERVADILLAQEVEWAYAAITKVTTDVAFKQFKGVDVTALGGGEGGGVISTAGNKLH